VAIKICVIGQGYVGLPLALSFSENGFKVFGLDNNSDKVKSINLGCSHIEDVKDLSLSKAIKAGNFIATSDYGILKDVSVIIVCVPTPLDRNQRPELSYLIDCIKSVSEYISKESLLIVESTVAPGTMKDKVIPLLEKESKVDIDNFDIAYSPERVDPLNQIWNLKNTPKIVAGLTEKARIRAKNLYLTIVDNVVEANSLEVAETAKLLENSFRLVNISLVNEISIFCREYGIDVTEVVRLAATKPYGFMPFYPGLGAGGHCIPVDPLYLAEKSQALGISQNLIKSADKINRNMPKYFIKIAQEHLNELKGKRILIIGVSYKPNVADVRETPVESLITGLKEKGSKVFWHDALVKNWKGEQSTPLGDNFDLIILATPHDNLDLKLLGDVPILNTQGSI
jgi:UDP-N-acetyl-D-glucosamine dehydrogenase